MRFLSKFFVLLFCGSILLSNSNPDAQRVSNWNFGARYSLKFLPPDVIPGYKSKLVQREGVSSISNLKGDLLFYSNGIDIWDSTHQIMPNGYSLLGHTSTTQSVSIIKSPYVEDIFYVFTLDAVESNKNGIHYSVVDMQKNNGKGDVVVKNIPLYNNHTEKISSILSKDKQSTWILTHPFEKAEYHVYELTTSLNTTPKIYSGKFKPVERNDRLGYLKMFAGGTKFATVYYLSGILEYGDFDPSTGQISNVDTMSLFPGVYGVEFSPDGNYVYVSSITIPSYLIQVRLSDKTYKVLKQRYDVNSLGQTAFLGAVQVGIDGKIYVADDVRNTISVINSPNDYAGSTKFNDSQVVFNEDSSGYTQIGLPNNTQTYYYKYGTSPDLEVCEGSPFTLSCWTDTQNTDNTSTYTWTNSAGDTVGNSRTVTIFNSTIEKSGKYTVYIDNKTGMFKDNIQVLVKEKYEATPEFDSDIIVCDENYQTLKLNLEHDLQFYDIEWSTGEKNVDMIQVNSPGIYSVKVIGYNGCFDKEFSTKVQFSSLDKSQVQLYSRYYDLCENAKVDLDVILDAHIGYEFTWTDFNNQIISNKKTVTVNEAGMYYISIIDSETSCELIDSIKVDFKENGKFEIVLPDKIEFCEGDKKIISPEITDLSDKIFEWSTGDNTKDIEVSISGIYEITVTDTITNCIKNKYIEVVIIEESVTYNPQVIDTNITYNSKFDKKINIEKIGKFNIYLKNSIDFVYNNERIILLNDELGLYEDTLIFESDKCGIIKELPIRVIRYANVDIIIPDIYSNVGETINLDIKIKSNINIKDIIPTLSFTFDSTIFYDFNRVILNDSIYRITGTIMLTDKELIDVNVESNIKTNEFLKLNITNGIIYIADFCIKPLRQVIFGNEMFLNAYPNPVKEDINLEYSGTRKLLIFNSLGKVEYEKDLLEDSGKLTIKNDLSSGKYTLRLVSGNNYIDYEIIIMR